MNNGFRSFREQRAAAVADAGGLEEAVRAGMFTAVEGMTVSEALILGLLRQGVRKYIGVFGHGSTELGEALRIYESAGLVEVYNVRSEIEASHAASALKHTYGETAAVFTSIGPGALQALSASLVGQSDGLGNSSMVRYCLPSCCYRDGFRDEKEAVGKIYLCGRLE